MISKQHYIDLIEHKLINVIKSFTLLTSIPYIHKLEHLYIVKIIVNAKYIVVPQHNNCCTCQRIKY